MGIASSAGDGAQGPLVEPRGGDNVVERETALGHEAAQIKSNRGGIAICGNYDHRRTVWAERQNADFG
jgi:hypothetical protein